jgi:hypothetical protein
MAALALCAGGVAAQQGPPPPDFDGGPGGPKVPAEVREKVELLLKWKLIEVLDLSEEQTNKFFPLYSRLRESRHEYTMKRFEIIEELKQAAESEDGEKEVAAILDRLDKFDNDFMKNREEMLQSLRKSLSTKQWASYIIFEAEFPMEIRKMMRENRLFRPNRRPPDM